MKTEAIRQAAVRCRAQGHFGLASQMDEELAAVEERVRTLEDALRTIARWDRDTFPAVPDRDDPTKVWSYGVAYGSNGERDFMRNIALKALQEAS